MMGALEVLNVVVGVVLRVILPLGVTLVVAWILKRFDDQWRSESLADSLRMAGSIETLHCWDFAGCRPEVRSSCRAFNNQDQPCWEMMRSRGQLQEACKACPFRKQKLAAAAAG
jgi:hypothetical protein